MNPSPSGIKDAQRRSEVTTILLFLEEKRFHQEFCFLGTVTLTLIGLPVGWPPEFPNESGDFAGDRDDTLVMTELLFFEHFKAMALEIARMSRSGSCRVLAMGLQWRGSASRSTIKDGDDNTRRDVY